MTEMIYFPQHEALYLKASDALSLGPGAFLPGLAAASGIEPRVVGKPTEAFFKHTLASIGELDTSDGRVVGVVGDDVKQDLGGGAVSLGFKRFLGESLDTSADALRAEG